MFSIGQLYTYMKLLKNKKIILFSIIILGFLLRIFNLNWDNGFIFHPDERAIIMAVDKLDYPSSLKDFFSPESNFNPKFFAYGNLPMYLLKFLSDIFSTINPIYSQYGGLHIIGRLINALVDTLTIFLVFLLSKKLFNTKIALLSAFFYAIAVFPIQNSHFFTVDILLTFFTALTLWFIINYTAKPSSIAAFFVGMSFGLALATKVSIFPLILVLILGFILSLKSNKKLNLQEALGKLIDFLVFSFATIFTFFIAQPYVLIDFDNFFNQITIQSKMGSNPFIFPYTLQYVEKVPILYELRNIIFFGLGTPLSLLSLLGIGLLTFRLISKVKSNFKIATIVVFFWLYFLLVSSYAVGWMRYLLPIYPILAISAGVFSIQTISFVQKKYFVNKKFLSIISLIITIAATSIWAISFMSIYTNENTKMESSRWINENIQPSSTIAIEHWDDQLPIYGVENYKFETLALYEPDTDVKWETINRQLDNSDYIILASNRLYTPLQKLTDCKSLPEGKCYKKTADYYKKLFSEELGFKKIAEFTSYPTVPIINLEINDQSADESFTVYDHPKIIIFEKE